MKWKSEVDKTFPLTVEQVEFRIDFSDSIPDT